MTLLLGSVASRRGIVLFVLVMPFALVMLLAFKRACLPLKIIRQRFETRARRPISQRPCDFSSMRRFIAQSSYFAHDTVLVTGGSVRNLSSGGRRISQPLVPGTGPLQR